MSGTSLDGMDAALVRFTGPTDAELVAFVSCAYDNDMRRSLEEAITSHTAADLARLHARLGHLALAACQQVLDAGHNTPAQLDFISFPGHTVWHEPPTVSWQLGDPAILAETFGTRVVHDFRARDIAAGGEGAPLVPMADVLLFGHKKHPRVLLNIGGMANLTYVPSAANEEGVVAFDTGPGMALIDALAREVDSDLSASVVRPFATSPTVFPVLMEWPLPWQSPWRASPGRSSDVCPRRSPKWWCLVEVDAIQE